MAQISDCQEIPAKVIYEYDKKIALAKYNYDFVCRHGAKKQAKSLLQNIQTLTAKREYLLKQINEDRLKAARILLMCFASCDLCTELADDFRKCITDISWSSEPVENGFADDLDRLASQFNKIVCEIDKQSKSSAMGAYYAEMAEEATTAAKDAVLAVINKYMNTNKGQQYF